MLPIFSNLKERLKSVSDSFTRAVFGHIDKSEIFVVTKAFLLKVPSFNQITNLFRLSIISARFISLFSIMV